MFKEHIKPEKFNDFTENVKLREFLECYQPKCKLKMKTNGLNAHFDNLYKKEQFLYNVLEFIIVFV